MNPDGTERGWGWLAHLRAGGTTPWSAWHEPGPLVGPRLPGAQQLELLRRLNLAGTPGEALADRVVSADLLGRGRSDLPLLGLPTKGYGAAPVDPGMLPDPELLRVATLLLAEDLVAGGPSQPARPRPRRARLRHRLVGDPWVSATAAAALGGRPPRWRRSGVVVVGGPVETMLADAWTARSFGAGIGPWRRWLELVSRRGGLPPAADLLAKTRWWSERIGPDRVTVVLDPALLPERLGLPVPPTPRVCAHGIELARRTGAAVGVLVGPRRTEVLRGTLLPRLAGLGGPALGVPEELRAWTSREARRQRDGLIAGGYAVVGDPETLAAPAAGVGPEPAEALGLALRLLLAGRESS